MKVRILRNYGNLKKDQIIDAEGNQRQFLLENGIACVVPVKKNCNDGCDECEDCKGKNKKSQPAKVDTKSMKVDDNLQSTTKKKTVKKTGSK
tara:strand:+ start:4193 stop:4468 length:276 start_codon:yes stop_codon:yes gene_type:complete